MNKADKHREKGYFSCPLAGVHAGNNRPYNLDSSRCLVAETAVVPPNPFFHLLIMLMHRLASLMDNSFPADGAQVEVIHAIFKSGP